jgi:ATP-dependent DNA helicase DinG
MIDEVLALLEDPNKQLVKQKRQSQVDLARAITETMQTGGVLMAEAPVGTGKSYAYSVPAVLAPTKTRTVIATAKKSLQDQLYDRDLPAVQDATGKAFTFTVLKGKSNYVCQYRLNNYRKELAANTASDEKSRLLRRIDRDVARWGAGMDDMSISNGDVSTFPGGTPDYWPKISVDECAEQRCKLAETCGYLKMRKSAQEAKIVVTNHHVLAHSLLFGTAHLGDYKNLVVDEAHQLPDALRSTLTKAITLGNFTDLNRKAEELADILGCPAHPIGSSWELAVNTLQTDSGLFDPTPHKEMFVHVAKELEGQHKALIADQTLSREARGKMAEEDLMELEIARAAYLRRYDGIHEAVLALAGADADYGFKVEPPNDNTRAVTIHVVLVNVARKAGFSLLQKDSVSLVSGTLAVDGDFSYFAQDLGISSKPRKVMRTTEGASTAVEVPGGRGQVFPSPFNYDKQVVLYTPKTVGMPTYDRIQRPIWIRQTCAEITALADSSHGNMFVLCSAYADLQDIATELRNTGFKWPLVVQAQGAAAAAEKAYRSTRNAVLLGSRSFFEGVDIPGDKLWCVVIPRLPLPSPEDVVINVKTTRAKNRMVNTGSQEGYASVKAFREVSIPPMIAAVRQAAGRVIRTTTDVGVVAITDPRIWTGSSKKLPDANTDAYEGYGLKLIQALGYNNRTSRIENVRQFYDSLRRKGRG